MKYLMMMSLILLAACSSLPSDEKPNSDRLDYYLLLSGLLNVNQDEYIYTDSQGEEFSDSLRMQKELERIYLATSESDVQGGSFSEERLKLLMFIAFYAEESRNAAVQEALAADMMPIYLANQAAFVQILKELPFLIAANCDRLNAYFGHEGSNEARKPSFVADNFKIFKQSLNGEQYSLCMKHFNLESDDLSR